MRSRARLRACFRGALLAGRTFCFRHDGLYRIYAFLIRAGFSAGLALSSFLVGTRTPRRVVLRLTMLTLRFGLVFAPVIVDRKRAERCGRRLWRLADVLEWEIGVLILGTMVFERVLLSPRQALAVSYRLFFLYPLASGGALETIARLHSLMPDDMREFDFVGHIRDALEKRALRFDQSTISYLPCASLMENLGNLPRAMECYEAALAGLPYEPAVLADIQFRKSLLETLIESERIAAGAVHFDGNVADSRRRVLVGSVFWGRAYGSQLVETALPTFLDSIDEDPTLAERFDFRFLLCCTPLDRAMVMRSPVWDRIRGRATFVLIPSHTPRYVLSTGGNVSKYMVSMWYQTVMGAIAGAHHAGVVNVPPDAIFSSNAMSEIARVAECGKKAVIIPGLRVDAADMRPGLDALRRPNGTLRAVTSEELTTVALRNLHQGTKALIRNEASFLTLPGILLWRNDAGGLIGHFVHLHPIYIDETLMENARIRNFDSIDGEYLESLMSHVEPSSLEILTEPEQVFMWAQDPPAHVFSESFGRRAQLEIGLSWLVPIAQRKINGYFMTHRLRFGPQGRAGAVEQEIDSTMAMIWAAATDDSPFGRKLPRRTSDVS